MTIDPSDPEVFEDQTYETLDDSANDGANNDNDGADSDSIEELKRPPGGGSG